MYSLSMRKNSSGFTIIEVITVVVIIVILATIATVTYIGYQNQARTSAANSLARVVGSALDQYFTKNSEYPTPSSLLSAEDSDGTAMTNYNTASDVLNITVSSFQTNGWSFAACIVDGASQCTVNKSSKVYYLTPISASNTGPVVYSVGACQITLNEPSGGSGSQVYALSFLDPSTSKWTTYAGPKGTVTTSNTANCPVIGL